jgi:hypothetical protein
MTGAVQLEDKGLEATSFIRSVMKARGEFLFDEADGRLRWLGLVDTYDVLQTGTNENDMVAARVYKGPASTSLRTLRIRTWRPTMPFVYVNDDEIFTGTCRAP